MAGVTVRSHMIGYKQRRSKKKPPTIPVTHSCSRKSATHCSKLSSQARAGAGEPMRASLHSAILHKINVWVTVRSLAKLKSKSQANFDKAKLNFTQPILADGTRQRARGDQICVNWTGKPTLYACVCKCVLSGFNWSTKPVWIDGERVCFCACMGERENW